MNDVSYAKEEESTAGQAEEFDPGGNESMALRGDDNEGAASSSVVESSKEDSSSNKVHCDCCIPIWARLWLRFLLILAILFVITCWIISLITLSPTEAYVEAIPNIEELRAIAETENPTVCIIGAGAAGLMAGYTLKYLGVENVIILEASSQFGGRTLELSDFTKNNIPLDLGAEWLHYHPNILKDLLLFPFEEGDLPQTIEFRPKTHRSARRRNDWIWFFYTDFKFRNSTWHGYFRDFIVPTVSDGLYTDTIVDVIDYTLDNDKNQIQIMAHHGSDDTTVSFWADHVIVATPVSTIQNRQISFVPSLPQGKMNAMDGVEFAPGLKVWLDFEKRFYADVVYPGRLIQMALQDKQYFDALFGKGVDDSEHILTLFEVGEPAWDHVNLETDEEIISSLLKELDDIYDGQATKYFSGKYHIQNWSKKPFIQGAYSYNWGELYDLVPAIQKPVSTKNKNQIYFAGEYTVRDYPASVTGAALSGRRTAQRLLQEMLLLSL